MVYRLTLAAEPEMAKKILTSRGFSGLVTESKHGWSDWTDFLLVDPPLNKLVSWYVEPNQKDLVGWSKCKKVK